MAAALSEQGCYPDHRLALRNLAEAEAACNDQLERLRDG
jgi:hypothetical protein